MKWLKKVAATPLTSIARVVDSLQNQTNDRTNAPSIRAVNEAINNNWLTVYPIGSIYMCVNDINPSEIFGGTWVQIKDRFLLAAGDTYNNGSTGGSATYTPSGTVGSHTLTVDEIPSHTHELEGEAIAGDNLAIAVEPEMTYGAALGDRSAVNNISGVNVLSVSGNAKATGGGQEHSHGFTGTEQNSMPPYLAVKVWKRTA